MKPNGINHQLHEIDTEIHSNQSKLFYSAVESQVTSQSPRVMLKKLRLVKLLIIWTDYHGPLSIYQMRESRLSEYIRVLYVGGGGSLILKPGYANLNYIIVGGIVLWQTKPQNLVNYVQKLIFLCYFFQNGCLKR